MIQWLLKRFKNQKMKRQILIIGFLILLWVLILVGISFYVQNSIIDFARVNSSTHIIELQDRSKINNIAIKLSNITVINQMQMLSDFYNAYDKSPFEIRHLIESCVPLELNYSTFIFFPRFCYQASGVEDFVTLPPNDENVEKIHKFISLLDQYTLTLSSNFTWYIQITALSPAKYAATFPFFYLFKHFDVTNTNWYLEHVQQTQQNPNQLLVISPLKQSYFGSIPELDLSYSIISQQKVLGYLGIPLLIDNYLIPKIPYNVMLVDIEGKLIFNYLENGVSLNGTIYIHDQNYTGFNKSDWQTIQANVGDSIFQLENKHSNHLVHVYALHIMQKNFTLIIYSNIQSLVEIYEHTTGIQADFVLILSYYWLFMIGFWLIVVSGQNLALWIIFGPLESLSQIVKNHVLSLGNNAHKEIFKLAQKIKQDNNIFSVLEAKLLSLSDIIEKSQGKKNEICKRWESFQYNIKERNLNLGPIKNIIENLNNSQDPNINQIKFILSKKE